MGLLSILFHRLRRKPAPAPKVFWQPSSARPLSYMIGGRRHLNGVPYVLPKDELQLSRLNFQHHLPYTLRKKHFEAPLEHAAIRSILDVGTGTAIWVHEMARRFPQARVVGLDIDPSRVSMRLSPSNYTFTRGNILDGLPFADRSFDYTHQRLLVAAIPAIQWPNVIQELVRVTRPGGYVELLETGDLYLNSGPAMQQFLAWSRTLSGLKGIGPSLMAQIGNWLRHAGLSSVEEKTLCVPVGSWGGRVGELLAKDTISAFEGMKAMYCTSLPLPPEQFDTMVAALPQEWNQYQTRAQLFIAYGCRKR